MKKQRDDYAAILDVLSCLDAEVNGLMRQSELNDWLLRAFKAVQDKAEADINNAKEEA